MMNQSILSPGIRFPEYSAPFGLFAFTYRHLFLSFSQRIADSSTITSVSTLKNCFGPIQSIRKKQAQTAI